MFRVIRRPFPEGYASAMVASLACGMPQLERHMAVFVAAADESEGGDQAGLFLFGGWVGPFTLWQESFAPAWQERVLNRHPVIDYLHTAELQSADGRAKFGLSESEVRRRIESAVDVIRSAGALHLVITHIDGRHFREVFKDTKIVKCGDQPGVYKFEPDYMGFIGFAAGVLEHVGEHWPDAETVNFIVEKKGTPIDWATSTPDWRMRSMPAIRAT